MKVINITIGNKEYSVLLAVTDEEKVIGLSETDSLPENSGMLFAYLEEEPDLWFTMEDTSLDLDIIFINDDLEVTSVHTVKAYSPNPIRDNSEDSDDIQFVLEVNANSGIVPGDKLHSSDLSEFTDEDLDNDAKESIQHSKLLVLDSNGDVLMKLEGGERIFSRIFTRKVLKLAIKAYQEEEDSDFIKLGKMIFKELDAQDNREPLYVLKKAEGGELDDKMKILYKSSRTPNTADIRGYTYEDNRKLEFPSDKKEEKKVSNSWDFNVPYRDSSDDLPQILSLSYQVKSDEKADLPRGFRNNNPLNLRISDTPWQGKIASNTDGSYEQFDNIINGYRAGIKNMKTRIGEGNNTIRKLIAVWAPSGDGNNDPESYARDVAQMSGVGIDEVINPNDPTIMTKIVASMARVENGLDANMEDILAGWKLLK